MINLSDKIESVLSRYESQKAILENAGILETFSSGGKGIIGIDGKEYPIPTLEDIQNRARNKREDIETKIDQGFTKLLIVPFGMSINRLHEKTAQVVLRHAKEGKFFATKKDLNDPNEPLVPLSVNETTPFWSWEKYQNADTNGTIVYEFTEFSEKHQGKTKQEILADFSTAGGGWRISLIEDIPNLPREKEGQTIGGRKQIEANKSPADYLEFLKKEPIYEKEQGITPEEWVIYFLTHLEETDETIDDYEGKGNVSWNLGAYFPESSGVPTVCFVRSVSQLRAGSLGARYFGPVYCARTVVRI